jgi:thiamine biosynthesis lipoprotein ApbE
MRHASGCLLGLLLFFSMGVRAAQGAPSDQGAGSDRVVLAMGTTLRIQLDGPRDVTLAAAEAAIAEVARIEAACSTWRPDSAFGRLNAARGAKVPLDPEWLSLLSTALAWQKKTGGAFDPVLAPLMRAWGIREGGRTPTPKELEHARAAAGAHLLELDRGKGTARLGNPAAGIDEGGFVKGYALDRALEVIKAHHVGAGLLNFGGQLVAFGREERAEIADPKGRQRPSLRVHLASTSLSTSGTSEHGRHILDPKEGAPSPAWGSVSVIAEDGLTADILSTALFVMGPKDGLSWAERNNVAAVFQPNDGPPIRSAALPELEVLPAPPRAAGAPDAGTATPSSATEERLSELERRVEVLSLALEAQRATTATPAPRVTPQGAAPAASKVYEVQSGLSIGGYGETIFVDYAQRLQNGAYVPQNNLTDTLRAVLYVGYKFTDWLVFNSEAEWEHSGFSDEHREGEAIVEFAYLDFLLSHAVNIRAGQLLLPVGFINELHEPPIFLGALRPRLEQENGIIPTTWHENGFGLLGELPGSLTYKLYLVNGLNADGFNADGSGSIGGGRQDGHQAIANKPAVTGRLDFRPVPGALLGGGFYAGDSTQTKGEPALWTTLFELHGEYRARGLQLRAIYAQLRNGAPGVAAFGPSSKVLGVGTKQLGGYLEVGYDVFSLLRGDTHQSLIPFARYENVDTQALVVAGAGASGANHQQIVELGANYKPIPQVAIKADYDVVMNAASTGRNQLNLALSYLF